MDVKDEYIPDDIFKDFLKQMPQVCVELVVESEDGVLLCKRAKKPMLWFWPGSRLYKGEELEEAAHRVAGDELGIEINITERLGVHSHFWRPELVNEGTSRHTVNVIFLVTPTNSNYCIDLNDQHTDFQFVKENDSSFHEYVRDYFTAYNFGKA